MDEIEVPSSPSIIGARWLRAANLLDEDRGWMSPGWLQISGSGEILQVSSLPPSDIETSTVERLTGVVVPGFANLHSHVHQRALAGHAERKTSGRRGDNFWDWREVMYRMLNRLDADAFEAVASLAFMEMLKTGFTTIGEFHYLHHQENGDPYDDRAELVDRILAAQEQSGIGLCLLPVLYRTGGIGRPPDDGQRRFVSRSPAEYFELMDVAGARLENIPLANLGAAPHSLRAVSADELLELVEWWRSVAAHSPIHMHISEQLREVDEILGAYGQRPISWLADHIGIDRNWTLIHATHADESELQSILDAGATVSLCPVTEGNLGDGIFPFPNLSHQRIAWGIGTDSNVRIDAVEEIRQLEYSQRLRQHRRSILTGVDDPRVGSPGRTAVEAISHIAEQSLGHRSGRFKPGYRADLVVLDDSHPALEDHGLDSVLDALLVSGDRSCISDVMVSGRWVVRDRHHFEEEAIISKWRAVRSHVLS